jgi:hypothetical protein
MMLKLEYAKNALEAHKNFNLAEVYIEQFLEQCPKELSDTTAIKIMNEALEQRNYELLLGAVDSEIERLSILKIKLLREKIINA